MKIKKIGILIMCLAGLLYTSISNADIFSHSNESSMDKESNIASAPQDTQSDIVTTEFVGGDNKATGATNINPSKNNDAIGEILIQAMSLMGISYKWGGNTPETGMDCSGFIRYVFKKSMGITLPRTADGMSKVGKRVSIDEMQPGDLILFNTMHGRRNSHIGMYIGNNQFIQSPRTGQRIQITEYNTYWRAHTNGVKRIVQENSDENNQIDDVQTFENVRNEALPSGYIKGAHVRKGRHHRHEKIVKKGKHVKKTKLTKQHSVSKISSAKKSRKKHSKKKI